MAGIKEILCDADVTTAMAEIDEIFAVVPFNPDDERLLELSDMIHTYESEHCQIEPVTPEQMAEFLADQETHRHRLAA